MFKKIIVLFLLILLIWPLFSNGQSAEEYVKTGDAFLAAKDFQSALVNYNNAINKQSSDKNFQATLFYKKAICEYTLKQFKESFLDCDTAVSLNPQYISLYFFRAQLFDLFNKPGLALNDYTTILSTDSAKLPKIKSMLYTSIANDYAMLGHDEEAIENDSLAIVYDPQNSRAYCSKGEILFKGSQFKEAVKSFDTAIRYFSGDKLTLSGIYYERGEANRAIEAYKAAINDYSGSIKLDPENKYAYWKRAIVYNKHGDYMLSINDYTTVMNYYKGDNFNLSKLLDERAISEINANMLDEAIKDDNTALEQDSNNNNAYLNEANAYSRNGDYQGGLVAYRTSLKHLSYSRTLEAQIYFLMAGNEYLLKQYDKAEADCDTSMSLDSNNIEAYYYRAKINLKKPEKKSFAMEDFKKIVALDTSKSSEDYIFSLYYLGERGKAITVLQQKLLNTLDNTQMIKNYYDFACLYSLMNKPDEANSYLKMAIDRGYAKKYAAADEDLDNIRNTADYKSIMGIGNN